MIYLVTRQQQLFEDSDYTIISAEESVKAMQEWKVIQVDSETTGRDPHLCSILCIQFGNDKADARIVVDTTTIDIRLYKDLLESRLCILQNGKFDLQFLYNHNIIPRRIYDTMIVEQLLYLGYPSGQISFSLKEISWRRLGIDIDKTVRGEIIWRGLDKDVIMYAAGDVTYLERIMWSQIADLKKKGMMKAALLECYFVPSLAYMEWCGIKLDTDKWKAKMKEDSEKLELAKKALDAFVTILAANNHVKNGVFKEKVLIGVIYYTEHDEYGIPKGTRRQWEYRIPEGSTIVSDIEGVQIDDNTYHNYVTVVRPFPFIKVDLQGDLFDGFDPSPKCTINWSSSKQVAAFAKFLGFNTQIKDKKTGEDKDSVLEKHLKSQKGINDEFLDLYFDYREHFKTVTSFGQGHLNAVNPKTGRIHTVFKQLGAASGRLSCGSKASNTDLAKANKVNPKECTYPNLQQLPADEPTRSSFVAPKGYKFVSADFSAEESRLGADIYQDKEFLREFKEGSGDTHNMFAWIVYNKECRDLGCKDATEVKKKAPVWRKKVKGFEFGYMFGAAAPTLASTAGCSVEEAQAVVDTLDKAFEGMTAFAKKGAAFVRSHGYIVINPQTGHRLNWWDWEQWKERQQKFNEPGFWDNFKAYHKGTGDAVALEVRHHFQAASKYDRLARNVVTQGTGAIILKTAMTDLFNWIVDNGYFGIVHICVAVHDEINCDYPESLTEFPDVLETIMENAAAKYCKSLPIPAEASVGDHWIH